jgi:hypothetical protein
MHKKSALAVWNTRSIRGWLPIDRVDQAVHNASLHNKERRNNALEEDRMVLVWMFGD